MKPGHYRLGVQGDRKREISQADVSLLSAARRGNLRRVKIALDDGANIDVRNIVEWMDFEGTSHEEEESALILAAQKGHTRVVKHLLELGARTDICPTYGETALGEAAHGGHLATVKALLSHDADGKGAMQRAIYVRAEAKAEIRPILVQMLLAAGTPFDREVLRSAISCGQSDTVRQLVAAGAKPNDPDLDGLTALDHAVRDLCPYHGPDARRSGRLRSSLEMVETLLEAGGVVHKPWIRSQVEDSDRLRALFIKYGRLPETVSTHYGVSFTKGEARATLSVVNSAKKLEPFEGHIDPRALRNIAAARPLKSISELAELSYVAKQALTRLRNWAL